MDCEACSALLMDYLYEELDEVRAASVRKHLDGCAACSAEFDMLSRGRRAAHSLRPVEAPLPNAALLEAIHAAAISNARTPPDAASVPIAPIVSLDARSRIPRWMRRVGEMAMRRQVAMAAVFLLMIGFGLSYHQFQAPTRPLQTTDEPSAQVIPATELPSGEGRPPTVSPEPSIAHRSAARPPTDHPAERRAVANARAADPRDGLRGSVAAAPPPPSEEERAQGADDFERDPSSQYGAAQQAAGSARNPAQAQVPMPSTATPQSSPDQDLGAALPRLNTAQNSVGSGSSPNLQPATPPTWRALRDRGDSLRAQGNVEGAAAAYREALTLDPPDGDRAGVAQALYNALLQSGQAREASIVHARYLARPNDTNGLAQELPSTSTSHSATSRPMPSRAAPRMRRAPSQNDAFNNLGL